MSVEFKYSISYGKARVPLYRVYAQPLTGVNVIPESSFTGRENTLFALEIDTEVFGNNFLPAYTHGDNSSVVATDSMKNFVLQHALTYDGATLEGFLNYLGHNFLRTYPEMEVLRITGRELPFTPANVPQSTHSAFVDSSVLFSRSYNDLAIAILDFAREEEDISTTNHRCGRTGLQLLKVTGSSFTSFVRDSYTTLPDRVDRPLFIYLDVYWKYTAITDMLSPDHARYIPSEQVRDLIQTVFHEFVSESIQHLVYQIGLRLLERFPQMAEVTFEAQNRTRDPFAASSDNPKIKVYSDPFPAYGLIKLTMSRP